MVKILIYEKRPWGRMWTIFGTEKFWFKFLVVGGQTSLQSHNLRTEIHMGLYKITPKNKHYLLPGVYLRIVGNKDHSIDPEKRYEHHLGIYKVKPKEKHCMLRGVYLEFVYGEKADEDDIERYEDSYGRV